VPALRRFLQVHSTIPDAPIAIALRELHTVTIAGDIAHARGLARAMICQLAVLHSPNRVRIVGAISAANQAHWDWLKWLPHNQHPTASDDVGSARMVYPTLAAAEDALAGLRCDRTAAAPQPVIVVDVSERAAKGIAGVTLLETGIGCERLAPAASVRLWVTENELAIGDEVFARPDRMELGAALVCARRLAAYHADGPEPGEATSRASPCWHDLAGIGDVANFTPKALWDNAHHRDRLCVPIGTTVSGAPLELDIKEAAESGIGPHGLCVGATGSGKSEFLRTVALGMMIRHSPEVLNLVLVDFKGGASFLGLQAAPHVAAVITNLSEEAPLVARMKDALSGEINRRQEMLRAAGNFDSVTAYAQARRVGASLAALPALLIIVDEFSELLHQHPDFADVFVAIGRIGRSLGMHLLLASQRLDEGRLRGLESHLSYRVCLKTLSANESRIVLGTSDAYELPNTPGVGYLRTGTAGLIRFHTAFVSGLCPPDNRPAAALSTAVPQVRRFSAAASGPVRLAGVDTAAGARRSLLQTMVDRMSGHGPPAHKIWLPPLGAAPSLDSLLGDAAPELSVPIGIVDRPFEQRRTPLTVDLRGAAGNVAVVGAPQSGKSTALRTLITALALTHDPRRVQFYCLDFGGGSLTSMRSWPHVGSVAGRSQRHLAHRMVAELAETIRAREALFCDHGIESMAHYRRLKARRDRVCDRFGDVFLVVDGWAGLRHEFGAIEESISALASQGLSFGVHLAVSASRWAEIRPAVKDHIGTRIELRLGDPADSELDRRRSKHVPEGKPGRGLSRDGLHMMIAFPRLDVAAELRRRHGDCTAPAIPLLPTHVDHRTVINQAADDLRTRILLGLGDRELNPATVDFERHSNLLILGERECGKTTTLRTLCREIVRTTSGGQAQIFLVDFRRTLLGAVASEHLGGYAASAASLGALLPDLLDVLRRRMAPPNVTQEQLRARSWWSGPDIYLVIDDYDLVAAAGGNPLTPIIEYLPYSRDLGLYVLVARRSGGAARAMFEPLLAELRDCGCTALLMSANADEGLLIGAVRPSPLPPGRGILITSGGGQQLVQVAWSPPR
jgi:S-DNA-T family DNA segregation ATPase FtsK/SpoIIIE